MFEEKPEIQKSVDALYDHCLKLERGDTLGWETAETLVGLKRDEPRFKYIYGKLKRRMRIDRQIVLWSIVGVGLRLLTHEEAATIPAEHRRRKMYRQAGRAMREMRCADVTKLSVHQRRVHIAQLERFIVERKSIRAGVKEIVKKCEAMPRRVVAAK